MTPVPLDLGALALVAVLIGALVQTATGMGFSLVSAPALVLWLGAERGIPVVIALATIASVIPLLANRAHADLRAVGRLLVPTLVFTGLIALALGSVHSDLLTIAAAVSILIAVAMLAIGLRSRWLLSLPGTVATGFASAFLNVIGGVGGPPIGLYAANADWPHRQVRANLQVFFFAQNLITALILGLVMPPWPLFLALAAGTGLGLLLAGRISAPMLRAAVLTLAALGALGLLARSF